MGLDPKLWGPALWHFIHTTCLIYPAEPTEKDKKRYSFFFRNLKHIIPCPFCQTHYKENIKKFPPKLESRDSLFKWSIDFHNLVNEATGKKKLDYIEGFLALKNNSEMFKDYSIYQNITDELKKKIEDEFRENVFKQLSEKIKEREMEYIVKIKELEDKLENNHKNNNQNNYTSNDRN